MKNNTIANKKIASIASFIFKKRWFCTLVLVIFVLAGVNGLKGLRVETSTQSWLSENEPILKNKKKFENYFGNSDLLACLIKAEDVFSYDVLQTIKELSDDLESNVPYLKNINSIINVEYSYSEDGDIFIVPLVPDQIPKGKEDLEKIRIRALSKESIVNRVVSDDSKQAWITVELNPFPENWKEKNGEPPEYIVGKKFLEIISKEKYKKLTLIPAGMPVMEYKNIEFTSKESGRLIISVLIIFILFLSFFQRSFLRVISPLIIWVSSTLLVYGFMGYFKISVDSSVLTMPILLALAMSAGYSIPLMNYFRREFEQSGNRKNAIIRAIEKTILPTFFAVITTSAGLFSFLTIDIVPVKWLGMAGAFIVIAIFLHVVFLLPLLLSFGKNYKTLKPYFSEKKLKVYQSIGEMALKNGSNIIIIFAILSAVFIYGLFQININLDLEKTYGLKLSYIQDALNVANSKIGAFATYNIAIDLKKDNSAKSPENLKKLEKLSQYIEGFELTKNTASITDIIKDMNRLFHDGEQGYYTVPDSQNLVSQLLYLYGLSGGNNSNQWIDQDYSIMRIIVAANKLDAKKMVYDLEKIKAMCNNLFPDAELIVSGQLPELAEVNHHISNGQINSFITALAIILILLMASFRSVKLGFIAIIPNIIPALFVGGLMGLMKIPLNFMTVTIIPMILGIAVDDTIHMIIHFKDNYKESESTNQAIINTIRIIGNSIFMTSAVICMSFSVYLSSDMNLLVQTGLFVIIGVISALISDLILTTVLLSKLKAFRNEK